MSKAPPDTLRWPYWTFGGLDSTMARQLGATSPLRLQVGVKEKGVTLGQSSANRNLGFIE